MSTRCIICDVSPLNTSQYVKPIGGTKRRKMPIILENGLCEDCNIGAYGEDAVALQFPCDGSIFDSHDGFVLYVDEEFHEDELSTDEREKEDLEHRH